MARTTTVKKAQKDQGKCEKCGCEIKAGDGYKWVAPRAGKFARGVKRKRCLSCPQWTPSELTSSKMAAIMAAQETFDLDEPAFAAATVEELTTEAEQWKEEADSLCSDFAETVRGVAEEYRESAQNIEDGFQHETQQSQELNEKADELDSWADECESASDNCCDLPDPEDEEELTEEDLEGLEPDEVQAEKEEKAKERVEKYRSELDAWASDSVDAIRGVIEECPV